MKMPSIHSLSRRVHAFMGRRQDRFLKCVSGIVHVGANTGQERNVYDRYNLNVIWIEPIPEAFDELKSNIALLPRQQAYQYLLTDVENEHYVFNVASNKGASSSILNIKHHKDIWPDVVYTKQIKLKSATLSSLFLIEKINRSSYQALIIDTQGAELLVLKGAKEILFGFNFIKVEVPDFEAYEGCCQLADIEAYLSNFGFTEYSRNAFAKRSCGGRYYDVVYERSAAVASGTEK